MKLFVQDIIVIRFDAPLLFTNVARFHGMIEAVYQKWEKATCNSKEDEYDDSMPSENKRKVGPIKIFTRGLAS